MDLVRRADEIFAAYDSSDSPGCTAGVFRGDAIVLARGYGLASLEHAVPIGPGTVFDIASASKQFTAACVLLLERDGRLSLDAMFAATSPSFPTTATPSRSCICSTTPAGFPTTSISSPPMASAATTW